MKDLKQNNAYYLAKKRVKRIKGFYTHLIVYLVINTIISFIKIYDDLAEGTPFGEAFFEFGTLSSWMLWGIGVIIHAFSVFVLPYILGHNWEERKIEEYMREEQDTKWE